MLRRTCCVAIALVLCAGGGRVSADVVTLKDGSRLVGVIRGQRQGTLVLDTEFAGTLELDVGLVRSLQSDGPLAVSLASGDRLIGPLEPTPDGYSIRSQYAEVPVKTADVQAIWPPDEPSPEEQALAQAVAQREAQWSVHVEAGGLMKEGNTDLLEVNGLFELKRTTDKDELKFYTRAQYGEEDDLRSRYEIIGGVDFEAYFTKRWSWYTRFELEFDEFEELDLRTTVAAGVGYTWIKEPKMDLRTRAGIGYIHEAFTGGVTSENVVADLGLFFRWDVVEWMRFTHRTTYTPSLQDFADYRLVVDSGLSFPLGTSELWSFKIGMLNEYDSKPRPGVERLDNTYYANLVLDVK